MDFFFHSVYVNYPNSLAQKWKVVATGTGGMSDYLMVISSWSDENLLERDGIGDSLEHWYTKHHLLVCFEKVNSKN